MKQLVIAVALLWNICALPAMADPVAAVQGLPVKRSFIGRFVVDPVKKVGRGMYACTYPIRHPLKTGKWMDESGFNGGLCGAGASAQLIYATRSFWIH